MSSISTVGGRRERSDRPRFRIGQKRNVVVHKFICRGTLEERIDELITSKKSMAEEILGEGAERLFTEMSNAELLQFVALDMKSVVAE